MCGIAGILDFNKNKSVNTPLLKKMTDVIIHRGPDSDGAWISNDNICGFGFRRLAIIDLSSNGSQPMHSSDSRFSIVFNGEIYNHQSIRNDLSSKGYSYNSHTDTETIINGYREYGIDILSRMNGMWSFALWDNQERKLIAGRDRIGVKPFYYYYKDGIFVFGSEIKSILEHPAVKRELNLDELPNYLTMGMSSNHDSLFKHIRKLPASHYLTIDSSGNLNIHRFWSPFSSNLDNSNITFDDAKTQLMNLLKLSIKDRMMSDVPFGVFLSGGIDSSVNVALMSQLMDRPVETFTVGFKELEQFNELEYANQISKQFRTNQHQILIDENDCFDVLENIAWHTDEPNADPVCLPLYFVSKLARESGTIVVQVGEGSDEQFVGYKWMIQAYNFVNTYWKTYTNLPSFIRKFIYSISSPLFSQTNQFLAQEYLRRGTYDEKFYWGGVPVLPKTQLKSLLTDNYFHYSDNTYKYISEQYDSLYSLKSNPDVLKQFLYMEIYQRLSEMLLMRVDKVGMAHSIEARVPFLDYRLVEFSMSLPEKIKVDGKTSKVLLKKAVEGLLPDNIIYRKKMGFAAPVDNWLRGPWFEYAKREILNSYFVKEGIFNRDYIITLLNQHKSARKNLGKEIYSLLALSLWHKKFF